MDRAARTNSAERRKGRLVIHAGGLRHTAGKHTDEAGDHQPSQKARARSRVVNFWGVGGPMHRPQTRTRRAPTVRPQNLHTANQEADRRPRSGLFQTKKNLCVTSAKPPNFSARRKVTRGRPLGGRPMRGNGPNGASFRARQSSGFAILGSAWEPGPRSQAAALVRGRKTGDEIPRSGRTGGRGPTFKKILSGLLTFDIYVYIFIYTAAMLRPENKRGPLCGI